jgi:hypothetical protein
MKLIKIAMGIIFMLIAVLYVYKNYDLSLLSNISFPVFIILLICPVFLNVLKGIQFFLSFRNIASAIHVFESCCIIAVGSVLNIMLPLQAGLGFRTYYIKRIHAIPIKKMAFNYLYLTIIHLFYSSLFFFFLLFVRLNQLINGYVQLILSTIIATTGTFIIIKFIHKLFFFTWILRITNKYSLSITKNRFISFHKSVIIIEAIITFWIAGFFMVIGKFLGIQLSFIEYCILSSGVGVIGTINITPGNIGILEWIAELAGLSVGFEKGVGALFMMIIRIITLFGLLIIFFPSWIYFSSKNFNIFRKKEADDTFS